MIKLLSILLCSFFLMGGTPSSEEVSQEETAREVMSVTLHEGLVEKRKVANQNKQFKNINRFPFDNYKPHKYTSNFYTDHIKRQLPPIDQKCMLQV